MKKLFWMLSIALAPMIGFTSCSDDDDDNSLAGAVKSTYDVYVATTVDESGVVTDEDVAAKVLLRKTGNETVSVDFNALVFNGKNIPVSITKATLTGQRGNVKITSEEEEVSVTLTEGGDPVKVKVKITDGTIKSNSDMTLTVKISGVPEYGTLTVNVTSSKQAENSLATSVKGEYDVLIFVAMEGEEPDPEDVGLAANVILNKTGNATVSLELKGFVFGDITIPVALSKATLTGEKGNVGITSEEETIQVNIGGAEPIDAKVKITEGTIKSKTDINMTIKVTIPSPLGEGTMDVNVIVVSPTPVPTY